MASLRLASEEGWVQVGIDHDTAQFAVNSLRGWWEHLGRERYPDARTLTVTADCGGANGYRTRLWKVELQRLADETGVAIQACHLASGTSTWNKIAHRLFSADHQQLARQTAHLACDDRQPDRLHSPPAAISWSLLDSTRAAPPPRSRSQMPSWKPSTCTDTHSTPTGMTPESREEFPGAA
jgi:hypothetical protein